MSTRGFVLALVVFLCVVGGASLPRAVDATERTTAMDSLDGAVSHVAAPTQLEEGANADGDDLLPVQLWTLVAVAGAAGVGLLLLLLRMALGWVKPPPPQEESQH